MVKIYLKTQFFILFFSLLLLYRCGESPPGAETPAPEISEPDTLPGLSSPPPNVKPPSKLTLPEKPSELPAITADTAAAAPPSPDALVSPGAAPADRDAALNLPDEGVVTRVLDGDTIEMLLDGNSYLVRYNLIDAPETIHPSIPAEPFGKEAYETNRELVEGKRVRLEKDTRERDVYGRLLRYVYVDGVMVNEELIRRGLCRVVVFPPDVKYLSRFLEIERQAQAAKVGIWSIEPLLSLAEAPDSPATALAVQAEAAEPENPVVITHIFYDGIVPLVEADEYIEIENKGAEDADLSGWRINAGRVSQEFVFPKGFILKAGGSCRVYTNEIHPESGGLSFGSKRAIWKNSGDAGQLRDAEGNLRSRWEY